ncbi:hypothetical protein [Xanthomonas translucens]|uniref:hypothetical protein n=1 Tax=Xanthomonas campestris pv. translucens TaxID=343 RepID=UPI00071E7FE9|nr:hypothetical protein [Xanthomonas translucens]KTF39568.1 hypothetical protein OZ12_11435 [Xanthomonas translucens pv. translucens]
MSEGLAMAVLAAGASLVGVLIGAIIPAVVTARIASRHRKDDTGYLAVTVSAALETYVGGCIDVMFDSGELDPERGEYCPRVSSPVLELRSLDVNWRSVPVSLLDRIFAIPNAQQSINDKISWETEHMEYPILLRQVEYGSLAEKALTVLIAVRGKASLPEIPEGRPDYAAMIREHLPPLMEKQAAAEASQLAWTRNFETVTAIAAGSSTEQPG